MWPVLVLIQTLGRFISSQMCQVVGLLHLSIYGRGPALVGQAKRMKVQHRLVVSCADGADLMDPLLVCCCSFLHSNLGIPIVHMFLWRVGKSANGSEMYCSVGASVFNFARGACDLPWTAAWVGKVMLLAKVAVGLTCGWNEKGEAPTGCASSLRLEPPLIMVEYQHRWLLVAGSPSECWRTGKPACLIQRVSVRFHSLRPRGHSLWLIIVAHSYWWCD